MSVSHLCAISITYSTVTNAFELLLLLTIVQSLSLNNLNRFCSPQSMRFSVELHLHVLQIICFTTKNEEKKNIQIKQNIQKKLELTVSVVFVAYTL